MSELNELTPSNFIKDIIKEELEKGRVSSVVTRFPPEPNGYIHIGHAKSIHLNFSFAKEFNGKCHLRFDDTNPEKEDNEYIESIKKDVKWLGYDWGENLFFASNYYETLFGYAIELIEKGLAYVDDLKIDEIREYRGTLKEPGKNSPYRERSVEENLKLFNEMREGKFKDGEKCLRAKIDMSSSNINMRDPVLYRIKHVEHHRTGNKWCIYPMYDFTHPISDAIEGITYSLCTLEFEDHRPLYNWVIDNITIEAHPRQIEFARLNLNYTVMSKRKLLQLVKENYVDGWDDPRMPTVSGLRRRGYTPEAIREFCYRIGIAKASSTVDYSLLEFCIREDLNKKATRVMAVMDPLKVTITNYPEGKQELLDAKNNPEDESAGTRKISFSNTLYVEKSDFMEEPFRKYFRLAPGKEVRFLHAYYITCNEVIKDENGEVVELKCTYDPASKGGWNNDGRKVKGTIHWVNANDMVKGKVRLFDKLFTVENPDKAEESKTFLDYFNNDSLEEKECYFEASLKNPKSENKYQFVRTGYFSLDEQLSMDGSPVFNRVVTLRDSWAKIQKKMK